MNTRKFFGGLMYLGGLDDVDSRMPREWEQQFGNGFGNRLASARTFGKSSAASRPSPATGLSTGMPATCGCG